MHPPILPGVTRLRTRGAALVLAAICALYAAALAGRLEAQPSSPIEQPSSQPSSLIEADALAAALAGAVTLSERSDGRVIYVAHCRSAPGGCEARTRRIALEMIRAGRVHGVDPWLLAAMALRESGLNPDAVGAVGELGVLQLHPRSARGQRAARACARAPERCTAAVIWLAAEALSAAIVLCDDDVDAALGAYNRGRCGVTTYSVRVVARRARLRSWSTTTHAQTAPVPGTGPAAERAGRVDQATRTPRDTRGGNGS